MDMFALRAVLYELLAGRTLIVAASVTDAAKILSTPDTFDVLLQRVRALEAGPGVVGLICELISHDSLQRPSATACRDMCEVLSDRLPGSTLQRWCGGMTWAEPAGETGPLTGVQLDALSVAIVDSSDPNETMMFGPY